MNVHYLSYPNHLFMNERMKHIRWQLVFLMVYTGDIKQLLKKLLKKAKNMDLKTAVMTFDPHPSLVLGRSKEEVFYITPLEQKIEILKELKVDTVFVVRFTSDFAKLTPLNL